MCVFGGQSNPTSRLLCCRRTHCSVSSSYCMSLRVYQGWGSAGHRAARLLSRKPIKPGPCMLTHTLNLHRIALWYVWPSEISPIATGECCPLVGPAENWWLLVFLELSVSQAEHRQKYYGQESEVQKEKQTAVSQDEDTACTLVRLICRDRTKQIR